ncbi:UNC-like C-terminal-domain-containing protein [Crucibulum laeve]|uniref:UNC-like C-terminal-domain-containing protein n=1 Tax=Crucibulum laeve TaxID=68775 RepID=A0A5C3M4Z4_9AGAR|nr:UNC-like C-terminal-domain-containing protein [Crucibulum laeve]
MHSRWPSILPATLLLFLLASPVLSVPTSPNNLFRTITLQVPRQPDPPVCCLKPLPPLEPIDDDVLLSFEEWKAKQSTIQAETDAKAKTEKDALNRSVYAASGNGSGSALANGSDVVALSSDHASSSQGSASLADELSSSYEPVSPHFRVPLTDRFNYANLDCSARVHLSHRSAKSPSSILSSKKDRYMLSPCKPKGKGGEREQQFVVVELCDDIRIDTVQLANFEFFSGVFKDFTVSVAKTYTIDMDGWTIVGTYQAKNVRGVQSFHPPTSLGDFYRYLRIDFHSHYGNEYYCPVSLLRVYGLTHLEQWKWDIWEAESRAKQAEMEKKGSPVTVKPEVKAYVEVVAVSNKETIKETSAQRVDEVKVASGSIPQVPLTTPSDSPITAPPVGVTLPASVTGDKNASVLQTAIDSQRDAGSLNANNNANPAISDTNNRMYSTDTYSSAPGQATPTEAAVESAPTACESCSPSKATVTAEDTSSTPSNSSNGKAVSVSVSSVIHNQNVSYAPYPSPSPSIPPTSIPVSSASASPSTPLIIIPPPPASHSPPPPHPSANSQSYSHTPSPPPPPISPPSSGGESIYRTIMNRLTAIETNHTLFARYIEQQNAAVRDVIKRMGEDIGRLEGIGRAQSLMYQRSVQDSEKHRKRIEMDYGELMSRIEYLSEEIILEKRLGIAQLCLLLAVLVFMGLTRGSRGEPVVQTAPAPFNRSVREWGKRHFSFSSDWTNRFKKRSNSRSRTRSPMRPRPVSAKSYPAHLPLRQNGSQIEFPTSGWKNEPLEPVDLNIYSTIPTATSSTNPTETHVRDRTRTLSGSNISRPSALRTPGRRGNLNIHYPRPITPTRLAFRPPVLQRSNSQGTQTASGVWAGNVPKSAKKWARTAHLHEVRSAHPFGGSGGIVKIRGEKGGGRDNERENVDVFSAPATVPYMRGVGWGQEEYAVNGADKGGKGKAIDRAEASPRRRGMPNTNGHMEEGDWVDTDTNSGNGSEVDEFGILD